MGTKIKISGNEPAMPLSVCCNENGLFTSEDIKGEIGLTIRQQFAAMAMQAMITAKYAGNEISYDVEVSVSYADALIEELNR